jgi:hypothetical protein
MEHSWYKFTSGTSERVMTSGCQMEPPSRYPSRNSYRGYTRYTKGNGEEAPVGVTWLAGTARSERGAPLFKQSYVLRTLSGSQQS